MLGMNENPKYIHAIKQKLIDEISKLLKGRKEHTLEIGAAH